MNTKVARARARSRAPANPIRLLWLGADQRQRNGIERITQFFFCRWLFVYSVHRFSHDRIKSVTRNSLCSFHRLRFSTIFFFGSVLFFLRFSEIRDCMRIKVSGTKVNITVHLCATFARARPFTTAIYSRADKKRSRRWLIRVLFEFTFIDVNRRHSLVVSIDVFRTVFFASFTSSFHRFCCGHLRSLNGSFKYERCRCR